MNNDLKFQAIKNICYAILLLAFLFIFKAHDISEKYGNVILAFEIAIYCGLLRVLFSFVQTYCENTLELLYKKFKNGYEIYIFKFFHIFLFIVYTLILSFLARDFTSQNQFSISLSLQVASFFMAFGMIDTIINFYFFLKSKRLNDN